MSRDPWETLRDYVYIDLRGSLGIYGDIRNHLIKRKRTKKNRWMTFVTTHLNKENITLCLNGLQCVYIYYKILHVSLYMIQRNVFKIYNMDDQIWYTRNTAFSETWQNGASISSFSVNPSYRIPSGALTHSQRMKYHRETGDKPTNLGISESREETWYIISSQE